MVRMWIHSIQLFTESSGGSRRNKMKTEAGDRLFCFAISGRPPSLMDAYF